GPSVTFTALARTSTPRSILSRASPENRTSFAAIASLSWFVFRASGDHAHDVGLLHDQELLAVELDLGARPLAEQHLVAGLDVGRNDLAVLVAAAGADGDDLALRRLLLGGVGDDDAALRFLVGIDAPHDDSVVQRTELGLGHIAAPHRHGGVRLSG